MNNELWHQILAHKKNDTTSNGLANTLDRNDINTILATMEFFNASDTWLKQTAYDLSFPRFRVFDWLAMCVMGRNDDNRKGNETALQVLTHSFLKSNGDVRAWIDDLRYSDYQIDENWKSIQIERGEA